VNVPAGIQIMSRDAAAEVGSCQLLPLCGMEDREVVAVADGFVWPCDSPMTKTISKAEKSQTVMVWSLMIQEA
jgi:hypothetical protein